MINKYDGIQLHIFVYTLYTLSLFFIFTSALFISTEYDIENGGLCTVSDPVLVV